VCLFVNMSTAVLHALALHVHVLVHVHVHVHVCLCMSVCVRDCVCRAPPHNPVWQAALYVRRHIFLLCTFLCWCGCVWCRDAARMERAGLSPPPHPPPMFFVRCVASALNNAVCGQLGLKCLKTFYP
jgi:hypothetical protein